MWKRKVVVGSGWRRRRRSVVVTMTCLKIELKKV
jgi:hypothetical protein